jgi:hypothetical protein
MARGTASKKTTAKVDTAEATEAPTEAQEGTVTQTVTEPEATAAPAEAQTQPDPIDLTAFKAQVTAALNERDTSTGTIPDGPVAEVTTAFRGLDSVKAKNRAKDHLNDELKNAINATDIILGKAVMQLTDAVNASKGGGSGTKAERTPADPKEAFVQLVAGLHLAYSLAVEDRPENVDETEARAAIEKLVDESNEPAASYRTWVQADSDTRGDEPEVSNLVKRAVKMSLGKVAGTSGRVGGSTGGPRRDIAKHILEAFALAGKTTAGEKMSVAEIAKQKTEQYPQGDASPGAVSARLKGNSKGEVTVTGVKAVDLDGKLGAELTADLG